MSLVGAATVLVAALAMGCSCPDPNAGFVEERSRHSALLPGTTNLPMFEPPVPLSTVRRGSPWNRNLRERARRIEFQIRMPRHYSDWIRDSTESERLERMIVVFDSPVRIPPFPVSGAWATLGDRRRAARHLVDSVSAARAADYRWQAAAIRSLGGTVRENFWLLQAILADVPVLSLAALDTLSGVRYVVPVITPRSQIALAVTPDTAGAVSVGEVIADINLDVYRNDGCAQVDIALLDTGVQRDHVMLDDPTRVVECYDCWNVGCSGPVDDAHVADAYHFGHGTCTAAILVGDGDHPDPRVQRGILDGRLFSYRVYAGDPAVLADDPCNKPIHPEAMVRAFQHAIQELRPILVAEMQINPEDVGPRPEGCVDVGVVYSKVAVDLASQAFDAAVAVIAANGNWTETLAAPALARRAIGVGMIAADGSTPTAQSRGPTEDGRIKPEVQAHTNARTAGADPDWDPIKHTGTSGSTPFAAGAAAMLHCWMSTADPAVHAGNVYAGLILGTEYDAANVDFAGAGPLRLPINGRGWWGEVAMGSDVEIELPFILGSDASAFRAALWWPEPEYMLRTPVSLEIVRPDQSVAAQSDLAGSFERAEARVAVPGTWKVRIRTRCVLDSPRTIYWSAAALKD